MAIFRNPTYPVLLLIAAAPFSAVAQQGENADETGVEAPDDFVHKGQVVPVAEQGIEDASGQEGEQAVPELDDGARLLAEFELFKQLMSDNVLDEADTVAKRVVELAIDTYGPQSNEFAKALTNLAIVQFRTDQFDASIQNFESAIEIIEDNEDRLNAQLVNPLKGLGAAQLEYGRPDLASRTFQRAVHVTHVNEGPHNLDQVELLESIAETYARMGDMDAAKDAQDTIYALNLREHELDAPALVPSLLRRADWQHRTGYIYDERATYRRAIRIIEDYDGKDSVGLVEPLIRLGRSYFYVDTSGQSSYQGGTVTTGEIYFRRAETIAEESPGSNWQTLAQAKLALADYYMFVSNTQRAGQIYAETWELLSGDDDQLEVRRQQLESIVPLRANPLPLYAGADDDDKAAKSDEPTFQGRVTLSYGVSSRGRATDILLVSVEPPEFEQMATDVEREIGRRIYRPRLQDGELVDTADLTLAHRFYYRQTDLEAARAAAESE